jgi:protein-disulfide isomerase
VKLLCAAVLAVAFAAPSFADPAAPVAPPAAPAAAPSGAAKAKPAAKAPAKAVRAISRDELAKALSENPDLILEALRKVDKAQLFDIIVSAQREYQIAKEKEEEEKEKQELEAAFKNPYKPVIDDKTRIRGDKSAPITIVEYSDFQCPYCGRGYRVVEELRQKYGSKMRFIYKHLPLVNLHPQAMPAARWQEAVALQSLDKAWDFHDKMFQNQDKLSEDFFRQTVKDLGLDPKRAEADAASQKVQDKIDADMKEGQDFGFTGTPGFLVNGIPIRGAYPAQRFDMILERLGLGG